MAQARVGVRVADDQGSVTIEIGPVDGPSSPVGLDLEQLTKVIKLLGQARFRMVEGTPKESLDGKTLATITEPSWYIQPAQAGRSLLAFDHPDYGPVAFALPRDHVARIVRVLNAHLKMPLEQTNKLN
ncbi:hypothetical protein JKG68_31335 [Microvirga aerilata]|uniref:Uncharacterized protein n=1 Tax=Microvirga aerilata TaxID=670292 RepID=A0A936ZPL9_9HYPH|nr:hypothetical protein [Microvirga aerilata]MBL0408368.1 hypothetical protein [Microvirga aerilata]